MFTKFKIPLVTFIVISENEEQEPLVIVQRSKYVPGKVGVKTGLLAEVLVS